MTASGKGIGEHAGARWARLASLVTLVGACAACVSVPEAAPLNFAVDDDELRAPADARALADAAETLAKDPDLHLLIIGHADEDNTDDYNRELSQRRADHARERILALDSSLAPRITTEARSEWDAEARGQGEQAKARNRRIELRFHYPRQCEPSFDSAFLACEWARLPSPPPPEVEREPEPTPEVTPAPKPEPRLPPPRLRQDFIGPYVFGIGGYAIASSEYLRQAARWGVGAGYLFGLNSDFRVSVGLDFDHLIDAGFVFPQPQSCAPFCNEIERSRLRIMPEVRVGGIRGGFWGWVRLSGGLLLQHREARFDQDDAGETVVLEPDFWAPGGTIGIGPGVAVTLTRHLLLMFDGMLSYAVAPRIHQGSFGGAVIIDVGAGLGWIF